MQAAIPHLGAQNLLRRFGQIDEIGCQFQQFSVADLAVMFREPLPILCGVHLHVEQYSRFTLGEHQDRIN
jgi:hypothetical protein